jgi:WD40 repeat protein
MVVGFSDSVRMLNILQEELQEFFRIPIWSCREIKFSKGGHLFACVNGKTVQVYEFATGLSPDNFTFKEHTDTIKTIAWLEDDSGFVTTSKDNYMAFWRLYPGTADG